MCESEKRAEQPVEDEADRISFSCSTPATLTENTVIAFGNPLLDMLIDADEALLRKYDLQPDNAILATKRHYSLYDELATMASMKYLSGGSILNSVRVLQWVIRKPFVCAFFGCIGTDVRSRILIDQTIADGVNAQFQQTSDYRTGRCAVLVNGAYRSLVADLGAAPHFDARYLRRYANRKLFEQGKYFITSGYFLQSSPETVLELAKMAHETSRMFIYSLSSALIVRECIDNLKVLLPYVDILFGGAPEALALGSCMRWKPNVKQIAKQAFMLPKKNPQRQRVIVFTRTIKPVIIVQEDFVREYPVFPVPVEKIIDTNGAGDAFMGGFLAKYLQGKEISVCVMWAHWVANVVIKNWGCTVEGRPVIDQVWLEGYLQHCAKLALPSESAPKTTPAT